MALEFNPSLHPPTGHFWKEPDGTKFRGANWSEVEAKVRAYREQRGPAGDVMGDIIRGTCKASPQYCRDSNGPPAPKQSPRARVPDAPMPATYIPSPRRPDVMARVARWANTLLSLKRKGQISFVPTPEVRRRQAICSACPQATAVGSSCGGCMTTLKFVKNSILEGHALAESLVSACAILGEDCGVSCAIVQPASGDPALPGHCWRRNS